MKYPLNIKVMEEIRELFLSRPIIFAKKYMLMPTKNTFSIKNRPNIKSIGNKEKKKFKG